MPRHHQSKEAMDDSTSERDFMPLSAERAVIKSRQIKKNLKKGADA